MGDEVDYDDGDVGGVVDGGDDVDDAGGGVDRGCGRGPRQPTQLFRVCSSLHSTAGPLRWTQANRCYDEPHENHTRTSL